MSNTILTLNKITRSAVALFKNTNAFMQALHTQYDDQFANEGAKGGFTLRVRLPNDFTVNTGPVASIQDTTETSTTLVVSTQQNVAVSYSSAERTMSLDDYETRVLLPMMNNLAGKVAATIMTGAEGGASNLVANTNAGAIINPVAATFLNAGAVLDDNSAPTMKRMIVNDPYTDARAVAALAGYFNPATEVSKQYVQGTMKNALGFNWTKDQTVLKHTSGSFSAGTVNGAGQTGTTLVTNAITGTLTAGDIITVAGVVACNRVTKQTTGVARQFVVTANVASGATSIPVYPAVVPQGAGGSDTQYQTVMASPANGAAISLATPASTTYRKNLAFAPDAITMATADLFMPKSGVMDSARHNYDGVSLRMIDFYQGGTDQAATRLDILFGFLFIRPEWCTVVADAL